MKNPSPPPPRLLVVVLAATALAILATATTHARTQAETGHSADNVWSTALRFLRVDQGFVIKEKDREAGYVLFDYAEGEKKHAGALEILVVRDEHDRPTTRLVLSIPALPRHFEGLLLDKLDRKLREELGPPPPPPPRKGKPKDREQPGGADGSGKQEDSGSRGEKDGSSGGVRKDGGDRLPRPTEGDLPRAPTRDSLPR